jgi:polyphosphate kinase
VELITPIEEPTLKARLIKNLNWALKDNRLAWDLDSDGRYTLRYPQPNEKTHNFHRKLMKRTKKRAKKARKK